MKEYIMAFDAGTTSSRCIIFNKQGDVVSLAQKEFTQYFPKEGWVEHDPVEIWSTQVGVAGEALYKINCTYENIVAIGITNQRETTVVWDKETGEPVYNAIVWQCRRTAEYCDELKKKGYSKLFHQKTGLLIDAYFSATKLKWILDNVAGIREKAEQGKVLFGTIDTYLMWKLSGGKIHKTDFSNAARTMMFNINTLSWDDEILQILDIPKCILPEVISSSGDFGKTLPNIFGGEISICGVAGDQQAALFGQTCFNEGEAKNTYGTGCFMLINTGKKPVFSSNGLLTTIAWGIDGEINYALEGSIFVSGAAVQWLRDEMGLIKNAADTEELAKKVENNGGVYFVPAFVGLGAPYWDQYARGAIFGITRGTNKYHIVRAALESICYQVSDVLSVMEKDSGLKLSKLKVDGGGANNDFIMEFQADILNVEVRRPNCTETTALGAAYLAGLYVGYWRNKQDVLENWKIDKCFYNSMENEMRQNLKQSWEKAVKKVLTEKTFKNKV